MKEFIDESSPKDIFQAKLNSMMEKSNSDNPMGIKRNTQKNTCSWHKRWKTLYAKKKRKEKKNKERNTYWAMNMLYWRSKRVDTLIAHGVEITTRITDVHMAKRDQAMILLLFFQQRGVSFRQQAFPLPTVDWGGRLRKMQSVTMAEGRKWKSLDLVS